MIKSKCCNAEIIECKYEDDNCSICCDCGKLYINGEPFKFEMLKEGKVNSLAPMNKIAFSQPRKEEEKNPNYCSRHGWEEIVCDCDAPKKSDESKSQSWEDKLIKIITNIEPWGYSDSRKKAYEEIQSLLTSAIEEERKRCIQLLTPVVGNWYRALPEYAELLAEQILNPKKNKQDETTQSKN